MTWLTGRLVPDHKTIADFRKDNGRAIRKVCTRLVELCREMGLLSAASVAIDGSKFKAVNNRDQNFTRAKMACAQAGITVTLPKPMTSGAKAEGRFGKQEFVYQPAEDVYRCPAGETLKYHYTNVENGLMLRPSDRVAQAGAISNMTARLSVSASPHERCARDRSLGSSMPRSAATTGRRSSVERLVSPLPGRKRLSRGLMVTMMAAVEPVSGESRLKNASPTIGHLRDVVG